MTQRLNAQWFSRKGSARKQNSDACAVFLSRSHTLAIIGDASERGLRGAKYVEQWMRFIVDQISQTAMPSREIVLSKMEQGQVTMRQQFPAERACYGALFMDHDNQVAWTFSCGDCRIGVQLANGDLRWITPVHSRANWRGEEFTIAHALSSSRQTVTRTLNSRRFDPPEIVEATYNSSASWILATDGYWIDQQIQKIPITSLEDDASFLKISPDPNGWMTDTDCENCYHIGSNPRP